MESKSLSLATDHLGNNFSSIEQYYTKFCFTDE